MAFVSDYIPEISVEKADKAHIRKIWITALILAAVTAVEFGIAFSPMQYGLKVIIFIALTFVKAFYIVAEFMHMKYEAKALTYSVIMPLVFLVWAVVALMLEGESILNAIDKFWLLD